MSKSQLSPIPQVLLSLISRHWNHVSSSHLIIGAGIGGLALAQGLRRRGIDFALFERDASLDSRHQGYRIETIAEMEKLRGLMLDDTLSKYKATCAQMNLGETNLNTPDAAIVACRKVYLPEGVAPPYAVDPGLLRRAMMTDIQDSVRFSKQFVRYEIEIDHVKVFFGDRCTEQGTLLIGADGSRSAVRKQFLPDYRFSTQRAAAFTVRAS